MCSLPGLTPQDKFAFICHFSLREPLKSTTGQQVAIFLWSCVFKITATGRQALCTRGHNYPVCFQDDIFSVIQISVRLTRLEGG